MSLRGAQCPAPVTEVPFARQRAPSSSIHIDCAAYVRKSNLRWMGLEGRSSLEELGPRLRGSYGVLSPLAARAALYVRRQVFSKYLAPMDYTEAVFWGGAKMCNVVCLSEAWQISVSVPLLTLSRRSRLTQGLVLHTTASIVCQVSASFVLQRPQPKGCPDQRSGWLCQAKGGWQRTPYSS